MITVKNLRHVYRSKKGSETVALQDVSFTFADRGMYFLVGKSGSGKSTLLNLLSGIDKVQSGELLVDGDDVGKYSADEYDNYRNNYAGLIFQEFNLIESMTVFENIDVALRLQGKFSNASVISESLEKVGLQGYEQRFPSELSGGERQRVTIARQLAKGSKLILADEPTGSLDSENGKNVFEILKELSKQTLIVVASHDLEFAQTYADEIVKFVDGRLVETEKKNALPSPTATAPIVKSKHKFPRLYALKFALNDIWNTKLRFAVSVALCFVSLALFGMFTTFVNYTSERAIAHTLVDKGESVISVGVGYYDETSGLYNTAIALNTPFTANQMTAIECMGYGKPVKWTRVTDRFRVESTKDLERFSIGNEYVALIESPKDIELYGYSLASGAQALTKDSVYITDYYAYVIISAEYCYLDGGACVPISADASVYDLVGKTIVKEEGALKTLTVAGIVNTDYQRYTSKLLEYEENDSDYIKYQYLSNNVYTALFADKSYLTGEQFRIKMKDGSRPRYMAKINGEASELGFIERNDSLNRVGNDLSENGVLYKDSHTTDLQSVKLGKNQAIVTFSLYDEIFDDDRTAGYYYRLGENGLEALHYPTHLGEKITLELFEASANAKTTTLQELEIVGVYCGRFANMSAIYLQDETFGEVVDDTVMQFRLDFPVKADKAYMERFLTDLRSQYILAGNEYTQSIYNCESSFTTFRDVFGLFGGVLLLVSLVMFSNFVNVVIANRKKDIGIIRAIGGSRGTVFLLFFMEGIIFAALVSVLALVASVSATFIMNGMLVKGMVEGCRLLIFPWWSFAVIPISSFIVMLAATYFPIKRIGKRMPVDVIRKQ